MEQDATRKNLQVHAYKALDALVSRLQSWTADHTPAVGPYTSYAVRNRLVQTITQAICTPFMREFIATELEHTGQPPDEFSRRRYSDVIVFPCSGETRPAFKLLIRTSATFVVHWLFVLAIAIAGSVRWRARDVNATTLLLGVGTGDILRQGSDCRFVEFCEHGPVTPLTKADTLVVQATEHISSSRPARHIYSKYPLFTLAGWSASTSFFKEHVAALFTYVSAVFKQPIICLLARDFSYRAVFSSLNRKGLLKAVVITNSNYMEQPLWMTDFPGRGFDTHMVWYSTNTKPLVYVSDPVEADIPNYRLMRIDQFWVWTEAQRKWLQSIGLGGLIHIVGPLLWYVPHYELKRAERSLRICVFDVTPVRPDIAATMGLTGVYYSSATLVRFIDDIMRVTEEIESTVGEAIEVVLKPKRVYEAIHDPSYISHIKRYMREGGRLTLAEPATDLYGLISSCDLVVVIPYSSPVYIATELGIPSVYYDATGELLPTYDKAELIKYAASLENLKAIMLNALTTRRDHCHSPRNVVRDRGI